MSRAALRGARALPALLCFTALALGDEAPVLRALEVRGATVYRPERIARIVGAAVGERLRKEPAAAAAALEARYHDDGYVAARVGAEFDETTSSLVLSVDEGILARVEIPALHGRALSRALAVLGLAPGSVVKDLDVEAALARLSEASHGALSGDEPPYDLARTPEGVEIVIRVRRRSLGARLRLDRVGTQLIKDRVSGWAPRLGVELTLADLRSYDHAAVYGQLAYGIDAKTTRFTAGAYKPVAGGRLLLGYEFHDLTDTEDDFRSHAIDEPPGSALAFRSFRDFFGRRGHEAYALARLSPHWRAGLSFRSDDYESLPVVTGSADDPPRPNPPVDEVRLGSFIATLQWASRAGLFDNPREAHRSALLRSLYMRPYTDPPPFALGATFEWAARDLGSDVAFQRLIVQARSHLPLTSRGTLSSRLLVGVVGGDVPVQKRFALGGLGTLRGYDEKEFDGEGMALANVEWAIQAGRLLPRIIPFADAGATWEGPRTTDGLRADLGVGLRWPPTGRVFARVDGAVAVTRGGGGFRVSGLVQIPF